MAIVLYLALREKGSKSPSFASSLIWLIPFGTMGSIKLINYNIILSEMGIDVKRLCNLNNSAVKRHPV
jgi:hypothetical protein